MLRTFNTLIIACNMCNQPREALAVYYRMLADGYTPNATTYNTLISAYGKTAQLDKALECFQEMLRQDMERSVITYSSLISACEKAGQWQTALRIFSDMQRDGCQPNTVTYNSLITACSQGAWPRRGRGRGRGPAAGAVGWLVVMAPASPPRVGPTTTNRMASSLSTASLHHQHRHRGPLDQPPATSHRPAPPRSPRCRLGPLPVPRIPTASLAT